MKKTLLAVVGAAAVVLSGGATAVAAPSAAAAPVNTASIAAWECTPGYVCFYEGANGTGKRCQFSQNQTRANELCSWGLVNPKSISNRSTKKVTYYHEHNYGRRIGSTTAGNSGNLAGNYTVRSLHF
ncbi:hypothetical protein JOF53_001318 [Crossiella equi]|uniref:Peptidase inhibitor n=1 Tax=Crossiella equi TaxID=130796 RepID=A0ABS5A809_9PSEU|nr:peptidase inhibitor family I36 protein [Crossiella equi]MBP2472446.1 hypothetical protein [Crossiella equi]